MTSTRTTAPASAAPATEAAALKERLYAALKHSRGCSCGECSGGLNAVDALVSLVAATEQQRDEAIRTLTAIAGADYRGNRSGESVAAHLFLVSIGWRPRKEL